MGDSAADIEALLVDVTETVGSLLRAFGGPEGGR